MSRGFQSGGGRPNQPRQGGGAPSRGARAANPANSMFDISKPDAELYDQIAEQQADVFAQLDFRNRIPASQLRRFFGEVKELFRRFNSQTAANPSKDEEEIYRQFIEPQFRMIRSKVAYTVGRQGSSSVPREFADFLSEGIKKVTSAKNFRRFVLHFEAVVGFMYGKDALSK
jgi:CRISPR-associated protein Csm2